MIPTTSSGVRSEKQKTYALLSTSSNVISLKSAAVKNIGIYIDIADIFGSQISVNIDIGKGDIDPALSNTDYQFVYPSVSTF